MRSDLQGAADAGALAGAGMILNGTDIADATARRFTSSNLNNKGVSSGVDHSVNVEIGNWNADLRLFIPAGIPQDAVKVVATANSTPLFFGREVWGGWGRNAG